jgi:ABC-type sugar transport system substrate-binding protein
MNAMSNLATGDRSATHTEVLAARKALRQLARRHGLSHPRVDAVGTVIVHSDDPGYAAVMRYADAAAKAVGAWVNVITDDALAAQVDSEAL